MKLTDIVILRYYMVVVVFLFLHVILSCGSYPFQDDYSLMVDTTWSLAELGKPINQDNISDDDWLYLSQDVPLGISYDETVEFFPKIGELTTEGGGMFDSSRGLFEAKLKITVFDLPAGIEFNYKSEDTSESILYSYYIMISGIDSTTSVQLFNRVTRFYNSLHGDCSFEREIYNYFHEVCYWALDSGSVN